MSEITPEEYEGKPVRSKAICEQVMQEQDKITKEFAKELLDSGAPKEMATEIADEYRLYAKQMMLGRNYDERPAFFPHEEWKNRKVK